MINDGLPYDEDEVPFDQAPEELIRRPSVLFTDGYLNNPIRFNPESDLFSNIPDANIVQNEPPPYRRDLADFAVVEINSRDPENKFRNVSLLSARYNRSKFNQVFTVQFTELS